MEVGEPKEGEIRVRNKAIGVNFIDIYFRKGVYTKDLPFTPGLFSLSSLSLITCLYKSPMQKALHVIHFDILSKHHP